MWAIIGAAVVLAGAFVWNPFARPSLEQSIVVVAPAPGVQPPADKGDVLTILYSGDGGWSDLDKQLGKAFAARGMPVIGINTFKYFWRDRSPDVAASQLGALITQSLATWHKQRVWLVGFSFGADVVPTLIDKLSPENRARVTQLVLLSPSRDITFEIELEGYMMNRGWLKTFLKKTGDVINKVPHYAALPPVAALQGAFPVSCYYGLDDKDETLCTEPGLPAWVKVHGLPGGHHFDEGYQALAAQMVAELPAMPSVAGAPPAAAAAALASSGGAPADPTNTNTPATHTRH